MYFFFVISILDEKNRSYITGKRLFILLFILYNMRTCGIICLNVFIIYIFNLQKSVEKDYYFTSFN